MSIKEAIGKAIVIPLLQACVWGTIAFVGWFAFVTITVSGDARTAVFPALLAFAIAWAAGTNSSATGVHKPPVVVHHQLEVPFITTSDGNQGLKLDGVDPEMWQRICKAIVKDGMKISEASMYKVGIKRLAYRDLREQMVGQGILRWNNPRAHTQGATPTPSGAAFIRYHAKMG